MTDKELLELAAKAVGTDITQWFDNAFGGYWARIADRNRPPGMNYEWNPLADDGDAFRLAVKLEMEIYFQTSSESEGIVATNCNGMIEWDNSDPYAATRRAIVRAAAEIGKTI